MFIFPKTEGPLFLDSQTFGQKIKTAEWMKIASYFKGSHTL